MNAADILHLHEAQCRLTRLANALGCHRDEISRDGHTPDLGKCLALMATRGYTVGQPRKGFSAQRQAVWLVPVAWPGQCQAVLQFPIGAVGDAGAGC